MFRVKTTRRNIKRAASPLRPATMTMVPTNTIEVPEPTPLEKQYSNFFEAESAATSTTKPWLRLERGLRLQKYRAFADAYPGLNLEEKESLYKILLKANENKLLNTKQQISYENGIILSIRGLRMIRVADLPAVFKIDNHRITKKNTEENHD